MVETSKKHECSPQHLSISTSFFVMLLIVFVILSSCPLTSSVALSMAVAPQSPGPVPTNCPKISLHTELGFSWICVICLWWRIIVCDVSQCRKKKILRIKAQKNYNVYLKTWINCSFKHVRCAINHKISLNSTSYITVRSWLDYRTLIITEAGRKWKKRKSMNSEKYEKLPKNRKPNLKKP